MSDRAVYLEKISPDGSNPHWDVCSWDDDGMVVLGSYGNYENAMLHAMSLTPSVIHRGERTALDQIDVDGAKDTVYLRSLEILYDMRKIKRE